jgi:type IVB pilus formation R64 PilN family outer membrane protein
MAIAAASLAACYNKNMERAVKSRVSQDFDETQDALDRARLPGRPVKKDLISVDDGVWLGDISVVSEHISPLPRIFETQEGVTLMTDGAVDFDELLTQIQYLTNLTVRASEDLKDLKRLSISYTGPLSGMLDMIAAKEGASWSYDGGVIEFYKFKTRTFILHTLASDTNFTTNISSGSEGSATLQTTSQIKEWTEIGEVVKSIVKEGNVQISPSTNSITVTAAPKVLAKVEAYIKEQNRRFVKQVAVTVKVLQVSVSKSSDYGLNLNAMFGDGRFNVQTSGASAAAGGISFAILSGGDAGTTAALRAISGAGKTSLLTSAVVTARNNRVVPINNIQKFKYVSSISTLTENTNSTTEVTPAEESIGFSMQLMPNILENGRLMLMFNMSLKELVSLDTFASGGTTVQLPKIEQRNFMQEIVMDSGQTAVLTGFEKVRNNNATTGLGASEFSAVGGGNTTETSHDVLVVMLTPQIIESPVNSEPGANSEWGMPRY